MQKTIPIFWTMSSSSFNPHRNPGESVSSPASSITIEQAMAAFTSNRSFNPADLMKVNTIFFYDVCDLFSDMKMSPVGTYRGATEDGKPSNRSWNTSKGNCRPPASSQDTEEGWFGTGLWYWGNEEGNLSLGKVFHYFLLFGSHRWWFCRWKPSLQTRRSNPVCERQCGTRDSSRAICHNPCKVLGLHDQAWSTGRACKRSTAPLNFPLLFPTDIQY